MLQGEFNICRFKWEVCLDDTHCQYLAMNPFNDLFVQIDFFIEIATTFRTEANLAFGGGPGICNTRIPAVY